MVDPFVIVGMRETKEGESDAKRKSDRAFPIWSLTLFVLIVFGCYCNAWIMTKNPTYMDLAHYNLAPNKEFLFGTDTMGRDIFSMIWYGGKVSLSIGFLSTILSTLIGVLIGSISGWSPSWLDVLCMRGTDILLSIPNLLLVIFLQAILGEPSIWSLSIVIGVTSWMSIAKVVRTEVRQIRNSEYVIAAKSMGGGFFHILRRHLFPNFFSSILFMIIMNIRGAIVSESTLSFMGLGLPLEVISWGSMLSLSEQAFMTASWWIICIPGIFLVVTVLCITNLGNYLRKNVNRKHSNL